MERYNGVELDPEGAFVYYDDAQRTLDAAQELSAAWAEKARQYELELEGDPQNLHGQGRTFGLRSQLATLQAQRADRDAMILQMGEQAAVLAKENMAVKAQLRQVEGERDALKLVNETHMKTVMKLSSIVEKSATMAAQEAGKEDVSHE